MKPSKLVNIFHSFLSIYVGIGWLLPGIHNKILLGFIPCIYANWLVDNNKCIFTRLEHYLLNKEGGQIDIKYEGFISKKLKSYNFNYSEKDIHNTLVIILFHSF